jgi:hypothetical protein
MSNNKQETGVQWFFDQLIEHRIIIVNRTTYQVKYKHEILLEQAKEMEIEQHANTWNNAINAVEKDKWQSFEQYYNETYGGGEQ